MNFNYTYDRVLLEIEPTFSTTPKSPCPAVSHCAMPISLPIDDLWHTMPPLIAFVLHITPKFVHFCAKPYFYFQLLRRFYFCIIQKVRILFLAFFFNTEQTVSLLIFKNLPMSRTPLLFTELLFTISEVRKEQGKDIWLVGVENS
jgi:hypothetical protein